MIRVAASVEGWCEDDFFKEILAPHLLGHGVILQPIILQTSREPSGKKHKGGSVSVGRVVADLRRLQSSFAYLTTFFDLYRFRDRKESETAEQLATRIAEAFGTSGKLIPYVQQYEYETLFLADPKALADHFRAEAIAADAHAAVRSAGGAEQVNDGPDTAPSKRIGAWCASHSGQRYDKQSKRRHALPIAKAITLGVMRQACPLFDAWVTRMETLGATSKGGGCHATR